MHCVQEAHRIIINIPTNCPAQLRAQLLIAFAAVFKHCLIHPIENMKEAEAVASLAELHKCLLPTEEQLEEFTMVRD